MTETNPVTYPGPYYAAPDYPPPGECEWFAMCDHQADEWRWHSVIGWVPICDRCTGVIS